MNAGDTNSLIESLRNVYSVLTGHGIDNQHDLVGVRQSLDVLELLHESLVNVETSGGVDNKDIVTVVLSVFQGFAGDSHRAYLTHFKDLYVSLLTDYLKLIDSSRTVDVAGSQQGTVSFLFQELSQLCGMGGLTGTLESAHHDDCRRL